MAFIVEEDIFSDPVNVGLFGITGVILDSDAVPDLVQEFFGRLSMIMLRIIACNVGRLYNYAW
jgi:hypothetical protein